MLDSAFYLGLDLADAPVCPGLRVKGLGFRGLRVSGFGLRLQNSGFLCASAQCAAVEPKPQCKALKHTTNPEPKQPSVNGHVKEKAMVPKAVSSVCFTRGLQDCCQAVQLSHQNEEALCNREVRLPYSMDVRATRFRV